MKGEEAIRLKTYVDGFDQAIGGGIPKGSVVLISGNPGTMKSSFAFSILQKNARMSGVRSAYVSLEQSKESLLRQMKSMKLDVGDSQHMRIIDLGSIREELEMATIDDTVISVLKEYLSEELKDWNYSVLVLDSLDVLELSSGATSKRSHVFFLFEWLREMGLTSLLISETNPEEVLEKGYEEGYLADGIINLTLSSDEGDMVRRKIRCVKMRNTQHETSYFSLQFSAGKFVVTQSIG